MQSNQLHLRFEAKQKNLPIFEQIFFELNSWIFSLCDIIVSAGRRRWRSRVEMLSTEARTFDRFRIFFKTFEPPPRTIFNEENAGIVILTGYFMAVRMGRPKNIIVSREGRSFLYR